MKEKRNIKKTLLKISVSLLLLGFIFYKLDKKALFENLKHLNPLFLPFIFLFVLLNYVISSIRWKKLLSIYEGAEHVTLWTLIKFYFIGAFFNNFLPTSIGGDVYKAFRLGKYIKDHSKAFASTFMERFSGVVVLALLASYGLIVTFKGWGIILFVLFWVSVVVFFKVVSFAGKKFEKLKKFYEALRAYRNERSILAYALFTSIFVQLFSILTQHYIFISLGFPISFEFSLFVFPVIILASFIIPSQNSFGVQEALYIAFFAPLGVPLEGAVSASIVYHIVRLVVSLIGGLFYAIEK